MAQLINTSFDNLEEDIINRAVDLTPDRRRGYQLNRLKEGASNCKWNSETAVLDRMLSLALDPGNSRETPFTSATRIFGAWGFFGLPDGLPIKARYRGSIYFWLAQG